jgi:hypothetical protein
MRIALLAVAMVLLAANGSVAKQPAREAGFYSSRKFQRLCAAPGGTASKNECRTYIAGVVDVLGAGEAVVGRRACIPRATVLNTIILVVQLYQTERPGIGHQNAAKTIVAAISDKWPCRQ